MFAATFSTAAPASTSGFFKGTYVQPRRIVAAPRTYQPLTISARYRGKGSDLTAVAQFKRTEADVGSPEIQIAQLSARVTQLTAHLAAHRKDYSTRRGLMQILSRRKRLLEYLQKTDRPKYESVLATLSLRPLKKAA